MVSSPIDNSADCSVDLDFWEYLSHCGDYLEINLTDRLSLLLKENDDRKEQLTILKI